MHASDRIFPLDALRGFAVMGILLMNIVSFAMPEQAYINPAAWGGQGAADIAAWAIAWVLFDGKMRGLFSLMFGASMLLVIDRAEMSGGDGRRTHMRRAFWLFWFGLAHYLLLWWGDILMLYALVGMVALLFVGKEPIALVKWAFAAFALHFLIVAAIMAPLYAYQDAASQPGASAETVQGFAAMAAALGKPGTQAIMEQAAIYRSGFSAIFAHELHAFPAAFPAMLLYFGLDTLGFMLLGMAMLKGGFLTGDWDGEQYRRTARHCFLIGLPPMIALAVWVLLSGFDTLATFGALMAWSFPFRIPLTVGYAALFLWIIGRAQGHWLIIRIAAAGRAAFSNYLGTSLVMCAIFYGWGLGLFGRVDRAPLYLFVLLAWALMLLWSKPWLDRFAYGPMEWLWRSLARGKLQPMRKSVPR
ncbi:DUF418 domain-containing protein [Sphingobium phenoxybenzoativorans]|uniref:DUF418 domain-containing protein n=1 Tax=Sphingobium phenoxybenzoativorans TaxID=1592790 RepID=A0A975K8A3_9SPHN|nr:DUF418 domain-containing protein [Sphingobium phenoxybenzoativorans]QUT06605.1 DUF418 domain-containing protein [Sphingobium phenoxybenzoativorans]